VNKGNLAKYHANVTKIVETNAHKMRNPMLVLYNIPEEISTQNIEEIMIAQNPELNLKVGDIKPKFVHETRKRTRNLVIEVSAQTQTILIQKKIKLGWIVSGLSDYLVAKRCFKCSKFNHRFWECRGTVTCPLCAGGHTLKECTASPEEYKCINCLNYNKHSKGVKINERHSALDKTCPSLHAVLDKYRKNTEY
jgi:hypothetical protein